MVPDRVRIPGSKRRSFVEPRKYTVEYKYGDIWIDGPGMIDSITLTPQEACQLGCDIDFILEHQVKYYGFPED